MKKSEKRVLSIAADGKAVSQCFRPTGLAKIAAAESFRTVSRLEIGDTAGWKPALLQGSPEVIAS